jgi:hypothetical protein
LTKNSLNEAGLLDLRSLSIVDRHLLGKVVMSCGWALPRGAAWSTAFWPYVTFYPLSDQGGMTIGSSLGDTGESNLLDTFAAPGSSQPFVIVGAPEPATWLTLALGFAGLACLRLRRTRATCRSAT